MKKKRKASAPLRNALEDLRGAKMQLLVPNGEHVPEDVLQTIDASLTVDRVEKRYWVRRFGPDQGVGLYDHWEAPSWGCTLDLEYTYWYADGHFLTKSTQRTLYGMTREQAQEIAEAEPVPPPPEIVCTTWKGHGDGERLVSYKARVALSALRQGRSVQEVLDELAERERREREETERWYREHPEALEGFYM